MKKTTALALLLIIFRISTAQADDIRQEALNSLATARIFVEKNSYKKAIEEINYALAKINELTAEGLLEFIPEPPLGFIMTSKSSQGLGQGAAVIGNAGAQATYEGPTDELIQLHISIGGIAGQMGSLAALGSLFAGMGQQGGIKSIRINGFTGTLQFDKNQKKGNLTLQVGDKTSVQIQGDHITEPNVLKELAAKINLSALEANY